MGGAVALELGVDLGPGLSADEAWAIFARREEAVVFALLELAARLERAEGQCASVRSAATPSSMMPVRQKPAVAKERGKRPGRKAGYPGSRRAPPERIDHRATHRAACCPHCQSALKRWTETRTPFTEDIPKDIQPEVTEHTIHRDWRPRCRKTVEPWQDRHARRRR